MAAPLKKTPEYGNLQSHFDEIKQHHMRALFENDSGRFEKFK